MIQTRPRSCLVFEILAKTCSLRSLVMGFLVISTVSEASQQAKRHFDVPMERAIQRRTVLIKQMTTDLRPLFDGDDVDVVQARAVRLNQKTQELIAQLEKLYQRQGQKARRGEIAMRLAELYYDRGQGVAAIESGKWEVRIKEWEALSDSAREKTPRPTLSTPQADTYRKKSLLLYKNLESNSRGPDKGRSQMIRRDEVLFFLGSTLRDLGQANAAVPHLEELVQQYPRSTRLAAARLDLGDTYFESNRFERAIPHYLQLAAMRVESSQDNLRAYSLYKLGWCYMNTTQSPKAVLAFQRALDASKASKNERRVAFEDEALTDLGRAFALSSQYEEGDEYFSRMGEKGKEYLLNFRTNAAFNARDEGKFDIAAQFFTRLIKMDPKSPKALDFAIQRAELFKKSNQMPVYARELEKLFEDYGVGSSYMKGYVGDQKTKEAISADLVGMVRREAKGIHNTAQKRKDDKAYLPALPFYKIYFKHVPNPNPDEPANVHEMRFFYAELLYRLGDFSEASKVYATVGDGKYGAPAAYNRILALRNATQQDPKRSAELLTASEAFLKQYPSDARSGDILYSSAQDAYKAGQADASIGTLENVATRFASSPRGVEAAERVLFILEEKKNYSLGEKKAEQFLANSALIKSGGADFVTRTTEYRDRASFKRVEMMPEKSVAQNQVKAQEYLRLAENMKGDLKEKALNNAVVHADKSGEEELAQSARMIMIKEFPKSDFSKNIYLRQAESAAKTGDWNAAIKSYTIYLNQYPSPGPEHASALWNVIYIQSQMEDVYRSEFRPRNAISGELLSRLKQYLSLYPKGDKVVEVVGILALREGARVGELSNYKSFKGSGPVLDEAEIVLQSRQGNVRSNELLTQKHGPKSSNTEILKEALGTAAYAALEGKYDRYQGMALNYNPTAFAQSLQKKMKALEDLEKEYIRAASYGYPNVTLQSYERLARMYMALAGDIEKAPAAPEELRPFTEPLRKKALGFLNSCLDKTTEYKIASVGSISCRSALAEFEPLRTGLSAEIVPDPTWIMTSPPSGIKPILAKALESLRNKRMGEVSLALTLADQQNLQGADRAFADLLKGLLEWSQDHGALAAKLLLSASDNAKDSSVREAANKNLVALNLQIGSYRQAVSMAEKFSGSSDAFLLKGLSLKATGQLKQAIVAYDQAIAENSADARVYLNKALAAAQAGAKGVALEAIQNYLDRASPPTNHVSRTLYRQWKGAQP